MSKNESLLSQAERYKDDWAVLDPILKAEIKALSATSTSLAEALTFANGCFEAAYAEGWVEAIAQGDVERIRDLWVRRVAFGFNRVADACPKI